MSKNIELQEEFEALIKELERLKSINEITSSNSENARNVIKEIKSFVQSIETFKTGIENDYQSKKKDLDLHFGETIDEHGEQDQANVCPISLRSGERRVAGPPVG